MRQASLAMYPFAHLREAYQQLWEGVVERIAADRLSLPAQLLPALLLPAQLTWTDDVAGLWASPDMIVAQTCGWPLVTALAGRVRVLGSFAYDVDEAQGAHYRSAIVATRPGGLDDFAGAAVAVNNPDSLSGWVSLRSAVPAYGPVVWTGAHRLSLVALHEGRAELAAIDAVSFAHIAYSEPHLVAGLHLVGRGPLVPSLPLIARLDLPDADIDALRSALAAVLDDPQLADARRQLRISGFEPLDFDDYAPIADLDPELYQAHFRPPAGLSSPQS
jgi:ABC-type phosphate/phosphonate transport system substrate-binding protein